jgi:hypothetical protein
MGGCNRACEAFFGDRHVAGLGRRRHGSSHGSRSNSEPSQTSEQDAA